MITFTVSVITFFLVFNALLYFSAQICTLYLTLYNKLNFKIYVICSVIGSFQKWVEDRLELLLTMVVTELCLGSCCCSVLV